jgi:hypothetical protein
MENKNKNTPKLKKKYKVGARCGGCMAVIGEI